MSTLQFPLFSLYVDPYESLSILNGPASYNPFRWSKYRILSEIYDELCELNNLGCTRRVCLKQNQSGRIETFDNPGDALTFLNLGSYLKDSE